MMRLIGFYATARPEWRWERIARKRDLRERRMARLHALLVREAEMCPNCVTPWKCNGPHTAAVPA
jgi:hypothetical protein